LTRLVFLFDVDGVLVVPAGYRKACQAAINFFTRKIGIEDQIIGEDIFALFESQNIISEWDMVPLILAAILDDLLGRCPGLRLPGTFSGAFEDLRADQLPAPRVDYKTLTATLGAGFRLGQTFADQALLLNRTGSPRQPFPHLQGQTLLDVILAQSRQLVENPVTRIFQQFVLGCETFQQAYGLPAEVETFSYLKQYDQPALNESCRAKLLGNWRAGRLDLAAYTIRPSSLNPAAAELSLAYSPEAELALQINGLEDVPIMGYGQVYRAAQLAGIKTDSILKPAAVQALGAIGAAVFRDGLEAMQAAITWTTSGDASYFERLPALDLHIFEDSAGSIQGVKSASQLLTQLGIPVTLHAWGIASNPEKIAALQSAGAEIFSDINSAVQAALSQLF
jgi:hypothetical protein